MKSGFLLIPLSVTLSQNGPSPTKRPRIGVNIGNRSSSVLFAALTLPRPRNMTGVIFPSRHVFFMHSERFRLYSGVNERFLFSTTLARFIGLFAVIRTLMAALSFADGICLP